MIYIQEWLEMHNIHAGMARDARYACRNGSRCMIYMQEWLEMHDIHAGMARDARYTYRNG